MCKLSKKKSRFSQQVCQKVAQWSVLCKSWYLGIKPVLSKIVINHFWRVFQWKCFRVPIKRKEILEDGKWEVLSEMDGLRIQHRRCIQRAQGGESFLRRNSCLQRRPDPSSQGITLCLNYTSPLQILKKYVCAVIFSAQPRSNRGE